MISLSSDTDILRMTTDAAVDSLGVYTAWVDYPLTGNKVYGADIKEVDTLGTTDVLATSGTRGVERQVLGCYITNTSLVTVGVTLSGFDGTTESVIASFILGSKETLVWTEYNGFYIQTINGTKLG